MHRISHYFLSWSLGTSLLLGCLPALQEHASVSAQESSSESASRLARNSGVPWQLVDTENRGGFSSLRPLLPPAPLATADHVGRAVRDLLVEYRALFGLAANTAREDLKHVSTKEDPLGMWHLRFHIQRNGVPLLGGVILVHLDPMLRVLSIQGQTQGAAFAAPMRLPSDSLEDLAEQHALAAAQQRHPMAELRTNTAQLYTLYQPNEDQLHLAYRVEVTGQDPEQPIRELFFINQDNIERAPSKPQILRVENRVVELGISVPTTVQSQGASDQMRVLHVIQRAGTYFMEDAIRGRNRTYAAQRSRRLPGKLLQTKVSDRWDQDSPAPGHAVDVHAHLTTIWNHFARKYGHLGPRGDGHGVKAIVHLGDRRALALFDGDHLLFGDGDGREYLPMGSALDVVAHEYAHAVLRALVDFQGGTQSRAVEEALADLFACLVEQDETRSSMPEAFTIGETIRRTGAIRDLRIPSGRTLEQIVLLIAQDSDHDASKNRDRITQGAALLGHAGYLLAKELGTERVGEVLFRATSYYLHGFASLFQAAQALLWSVQDLHGATSQEAHKARLVFLQAGFGDLENAGKIVQP